MLAAVALRVAVDLRAPSPGSPGCSTRSRAWPCSPSSLPITGLTATTAEIGLVSYTLLILVRNIVAGIDGVPAAVQEAADGMGYRPLAALLRRRPPPGHARRSWPGLRIASVTTVGLVTVTALIG